MPCVISFSCAFCFLLVLLTPLEALALCRGWVGCWLPNGLDSDLMTPEVFSNPYDSLKTRLLLYFTFLSHETPTLSLCLLPACLLLQGGQLLSGLEHSTAQPCVRGTVSAAQSLACRGSCAEQVGQVWGNAQGPVLTAGLLPTCEP